MLISGFVCALAILFIVMAWKLFDLRIERDFFLLLLIVEVWVYLFLAPTVNFPIEDDERQVRYVAVELSLLLLFMVPMIMTYRKHMTRAMPSETNRVGLSVNPNGALIASIGIILVTIGFVATISLNELVFVRLSTGLPEAKAELSLIELGLLRIFGRGGYAIVGLAFLMWRLADVGSLVRKTSGLALLTSGIVLFLFSIVNSRLLSVLMVFFLVGLWYVTGGRLKMKRRTKKILVVVAALVLIYSYRVVINVRSNFFFEGIKLEYFDPFYKSPEISGGEFWSRLDLVFFISEITPGASRDGFALGAVWSVPIFLTYAPLFYPEESEYLKKTFMTDAESHLMVRYTDLHNETMDVNSGRVTDAYGNFFVFGFLLAAYIMARLLVYSTVTFFRGGSSFRIVLSFFIIAQLLIFEDDLINLPLSLIKAMVVIIPFSMCKPFSTRYVFRPEKA